MVKPARRQHFIARFYLRNFAEPMFSDNLFVYDLQTKRWEKRTPEGVGWFPHLCSLINMEGRRSDEFDRYLKVSVEDPAAPALKKMAMSEALNADERGAVALFISLTAARSPDLMSRVVAEHIKGLDAAERAELDQLVRLWSGWVGKPYGLNSHTEFLKPSSFGAIWIWARSLQQRLLRWQWHLVRTSRDAPFVTSDYPVFAERGREQSVRLVSFPVSSELALIVINGGQYNETRDRSREALVVNRQSTCRATDFVISCRQDFPGLSVLPTEASGPGSSA